MQKMLSQLLPEITLSTDIEISGITDDSRKVALGDLFLAVAGETFDARDFIPEVAKKSAAAIIADPPYGCENVSGVPVFSMNELAVNKGRIAAEFYDNPSKQMQMIVVTGTNGKTSVTQYVANALVELSRNCGIVGTMGYGFGNQLSNPGLTTPDAISLQKTLAELYTQGAKAVTLEASSHGLVQARLNGVQINVAVFTNLTRDHLDYHKSFAGYKNAKQQLFERDELDAAVINIDDDFGKTLSQLPNRTYQVLTYSLHDTDADIRCKTLEFLQAGFSAVVETPWGGVELSSPLLGSFNVSNLLSVVAVLGQQGFTVDDISRSVSGLTNVRGRMDMLVNEKYASVVIDYAHTPDALEKAIAAIQLHCQQDIWCVMGCGGDRDRGKRSQMGEVSSRLAQHTIVTDDNPRNESSDQIIDDILQGIKSGARVNVRPDRKEAIKYALSSAKPEDIILIAGKGHEEYQEIAGVKKAYSDYAEVEKFFGKRRGSEEI